MVIIRHLQASIKTIVQISQTRRRDLRNINHAESCHRTRWRPQHLTISK